MTSPSPAPATSEPILIAEAARSVIVLAVMLGWVTIPSQLIDSITTAVAALASVGLSVWARSRVTPAS